MDAPIEFAAAPLLKEGKRRKKTDQYRGQRRKACMLRNPCKWARNASLARQPSRCSKYKATRTDGRQIRFLPSTFGVPCQMLASPVGESRALSLSRHGRTDPTDGIPIPHMRASSPSSSSSQFSNLSSTPMTPDRRRARRRAAASVCPGPVAVGPPLHYAKSSMRRPPPSPFGQPRDRPR